jgi:hypothetical protein
MYFKGGGLDQKWGYYGYLAYAVAPLLLDAFSLAAGNLTYYKAWALHVISDG